MLKITPYLGILVMIVSIAGLWFPILGYFMAVLFATLLLISPFRGRCFYEIYVQEEALIVS